MSCSSKENNDKYRRPIPHPFPVSALFITLYRLSKLLLQQIQNSDTVNKYL